MFFLLTPHFKSNLSLVLFVQVFLTKKDVILFTHEEKTFPLELIKLGNRKKYTKGEWSCRRELYKEGGLKLSAHYTVARCAYSWHWKLSFSMKVACIFLSNK